MNNENNEFNSVDQYNVDQSISQSVIVDQSQQVLNNEEVNSTIQSIVPEGSKKNNSLIIIFMITILLIGIFLIVFFLFCSSNKNNPVPNNVPANNSAVSVETEFLTLANKYVAAVNKLWTSDSMECQNAVDQTEILKPSNLSDIDAYGGSAFYYVFINTKDENEMKLDVDDQRSVAGWVRIKKSDNSYYIALSDGKNYIVDRGTEFGISSSNLSEKDVVTTGNGYNYQYMNGEIFGSNTEGNGWGIGDYILLTDGDDSNDGIYMSNGKKTSGWTPFCSNVLE